MWINHVAIYGNNIDAMYLFYHSILGFPEMERSFDDLGKVRMIRLKITKNQYLEIFNFNSMQIEKRNEYVNRGYMHLGFASSDVREMRDQLVSNNIIICEDIKVGHDGLKHFFIEDPEKNLIEITEEIGGTYI